MKQRTLLIAVLGLVLNGCSQDTGPYGGHPYAWYASHIKEARAQVQWCKEKSTHPDDIDACKLAQRAVDEDNMRTWFMKKPTPGGF